MRLSGCAVFAWWQSLLVPQLPGELINAKPTGHPVPHLLQKGKHLLGLEREARLILVVCSLLTKSDA
jgi:hypothetical protein